MTEEEVVKIIGGDKVGKNGPHNIYLAEGIIGKLDHYTTI